MLSELPACIAAMEACGSARHWGRVAHAAATASQRSLMCWTLPRSVRFCGRSRPSIMRLPN